MIVLDLAYWQLRWRPFRDLAFLQSRSRGGYVRPRAGDDVRLASLPSEFFTSRGEWLD